MSRKDAEKRLRTQAYVGPIVWFRSPYAATALGATVLRSMGISPTRRKTVRRATPLAEWRAIQQVLSTEFQRWPRPQVDVTEERVRELRGHLGRIDIAAELPQIRHQLNSHIDSSIGVLNSLFYMPDMELDGGELVYVFGGAVVAVDEPDFVRCDNEGRLHGETGPAMRWRDGWSVFVWHGTVVPEAWVREKDKIDVEVALTWPNIEERRAAAEIMGWKKVLTKLNATMIDKHEDPAIGTLWHADLPFESAWESATGRWPRVGARTEPCRFIEVKCGTGRMFVIPVPPTIQTAMAAQEWMWGLGPGEYKPEART